MDTDKITNISKETSVLVWKEANLYVARSLEVEIASQGKTKKEALENLKEALELYFEKELPAPKLSLHHSITPPQG